MNYLDTLSSRGKSSTWGEYKNQLNKSSKHEEPTQEEVEAEVARLQKEWEDTEYQRLRAKEYPDVKEYLDGLVKGDTEQMQAYIDACLAVKAKYPKPEGVE